MKSVSGESQFTGAGEWALVVGAGRIEAADTVISLTLVDIWNTHFCSEKYAEEDVNLHISICGIVYQLEITQKALK